VRLPALAASCSVSRSLLSNSKRSKSKWTLYCIMVPGLFVPKTFRSQERIVHMGNFRSRDFSFPGTFVPWERKFPGTFVAGPFRSPGTFVPGERKFLGTFVPCTFRAEELSLPGLFVPRNFRSSDYFTRYWLRTQTAIATVRICFVVGLVVFAFQK